MTKRDQTYQLVKVAGYHNDGRAATRVLIENPISIKRYNEAWQEGVSARKQGMRCLCRDCAGGRP